MERGCERFNAKHPIGTIIHVWPSAIGHGEPQIVTIVEPGAYVLGDHTPVVQVTGRHGSIALTHVLRSDP